MSLRLAGAPISWGVSEVPGWGHQMAGDRVLAEMRGAGLAATELGPPGFLPAEPQALRRALARHDLTLAAGFAAVVLHQPHRRPVAMTQLAAAARLLNAAGAGVLIVAAAGAGRGYDGRERLDGAGWAALADAVADADALARAHGLRLALHPHVGTVIERHDEVRRLLELTDAGICLDTGHLAVAGGDPLRMAVEAGSRVVHVHLKDVDGALARRLRAGELGFAEAVRHGLFRPLGAGDVDVHAVLHRLEAAGYGGWLTLEQDAVLTGEPDLGGGPVRDVRRSME
ncbi:MAG TPA: TIM barrel protein, partial [Candidatus Dormibacteraeota bacterium]|nr:TIM barrel protein [Candidatus Dormibacteraeota bacterium]